MNLARITTGFVAAAASLAVALTGCTAEEPAATRPGPSPTAAAPSSTSAPATPVDPEPTPTQPTQPHNPEKDAEYQAEIAAWPHPLPPGYAWPESWSDLPYFGVGGQQTAYLNAAGIYHCMLVGAAWDAYFTDNDPVTSKRYAAMADAFVPTVDYTLRVTNDDGTIRDHDLAAESGICRGLVGDLTR